ncbi:hypothetical protein AB0N06_15525 [Streptomyces sp. NPDC051020]
MARGRVRTVAARDDACMTDDLVEFLRARLDEEADLARRCLRDSD